MNPYLLAKLVHVAGAIVSLGAMLMLPLLLGALQSERIDARTKALVQAALERAVSLGGWALIVSGAGLLHLRGWSEAIEAFWMAGSLVLLVVALGLEKWLERRDWAPRWLWLRAAPFCLILGLMVLKPA